MIRLGIFLVIILNTYAVKSQYSVEFREIEGPSLIFYESLHVYNIDRYFEMQEWPPNIQIEEDEITKSICNLKIDRTLSKMEYDQFQEAIKNACQIKGDLINPNIIGGYEYDLTLNCNGKSKKITISNYKDERVQYLMNLIQEFTK